MIRTARLDLIPVTVELVRADLVGRQELQRVLGIRVPESWPPHLYDKTVMQFTIDKLERHPEHPGWWAHYFVRRAEAPGSQVVIGLGGYKGPPDAEGTVEIGYGVLTEFRRQGYASEAAAALVQHAFEHPEVIRVIAETLPSLAPSIGVLEKCGFTYVGEGSQDGVIRYQQPRDKHSSRRTTRYGPARGQAARD